MSAPSCARPRRSALAGVIVTERHAPADTGVLAKAASGALEIVPLVRAVNLARTLDQLKEAGFWLYGLDERGDVGDRRRSISSGRVCIVLGAEGEGLRRLTAEKCDRLVTIPTEAALAALNVSNAAAVAAYEWARQAKTSDLSTRTYRAQFGRAAASSRNHGPTWKTLISTYIGTMPPIGERRAEHVERRAAQSRDQRHDGEGRRGRQR